MQWNMRNQLDAVPTNVDARHGDHADLALSAQWALFVERGREGAGERSQLAEQDAATACHCLPARGYG